MESFLHWSEFVIGLALVFALILSDVMRISENKNNKDQSE